MSWEFSTDPEFERKLEWMRTFVDEEVLPLETLDVSWDRLMSLLAPLQDRVRAESLWAAHLPSELGGQGYGQVRLGLMHEILGRSTPLAPITFGNSAPDSGNSEILALAGTPSQKERYLYPLLAGQLTSAFSMTEPNTPGSDPTMLATRAVRDPDGYVITGRKWFTTNASIADFLIVMAVTDPDAPRHRRASMFVVPVDTPGVEIVREVPTMEHPVERYGHFGNHCEVAYHDVRLPAQALLGSEGDGFSIAQTRLGPGRIHHAMRWVGVANRGLDMLCERALTREAHGSLLADKQTVQNWIADSVTQIHAARLMTLHAAWVMDTHGQAAARREIAMIKVYGAEVMHAVLDRAIQVHGALGYSCDLPLESMYRYSRAARIYDGPDEVHRQTIARMVLRDHEPAPGGVPTEHIPTRRNLANKRFAHITVQTHPRSVTAPRNSA